VRRGQAPCAGGAEGARQLRSDTGEISEMATAAWQRAEAAQILKSQTKHYTKLNHYTDTVLCPGTNSPKSVP
jgi:hypothetical protein